MGGLRASLLEHAMVTYDQAGRAGGRVEIAAPPPDLASLVEYSWVEHNWIGRGAAPVTHASSAWRIVPDPCAHLIFSVDCESCGGAARLMVVGARSRHVDVDVSRRRLTVGVRLRAGALAALTRERASAFTDRAFGAEDVFGPPAKVLLERLGVGEARAGLDEMMTLLRDRRPTRAVGMLYAAARQASTVASLAAGLSLPPRTLYARLFDEVGLAPRRLLRIERLHRVLGACHLRPRWADLAADAGYADQPHLVREFRSLLGETPVSWLARRKVGETFADSFKTALSRRR
jgi:AraC-like DNA-binding protein